MLLPTPIGLCAHTAFPCLERVLPTLSRERAEIVGSILCSYGAVPPGESVELAKHCSTHTVGTAAPHMGFTPPEESTELEILSGTHTWGCPMWSKRSAAVPALEAAPTRKRVELLGH